MKKMITLIWIAIGSTFACKAQEGYRVSGKINGVSDGILLLMSDEKGKPDTLGTTRIVNEAFVFTGKVDTPVAAYITTADQKGIIPLILENTIFMVNATTSGTLIKGGALQDIYGQFGKINMTLLREQEKIMEELRPAQRQRDAKKMQALKKQFEEAVENARLKEIELLKEYADTYVAAHVVATEMQQSELEPLKAKYELLGDAAKATIPGKAVAVFIEEMEKLVVGEIAPDFTIVSPRGDSLSLHSTKGKLKLLHFWNSGSTLCRHENVNLLNLYQKYHLKGLEIISVSQDQNKQAWIKALTEDGMIWKHGLDRDSAIRNLYHVKNLPCSILLDEENRIIAKNLSDDDLKKKMAERLKKK